MSEFQIKKASRQAVIWKKPSIAGPKNPNWKGGERLDKKSGRVMVYSPHHPYPNYNNYVYRYRLLMERKLQRFLLPTEHVHHINGDPNDDRIENLQLVSNSEHAKITHCLAYRGKWARSYDCCVSCGTTTIPHGGSGLCNRCYEKRRDHKRRIR
jgi:HNH endonuclease